MGRNKDSQFCESLLINNRTYLQYYNRLTELAISMFKWNNLPSTVDSRFLEMCLFSDGVSVFFNDEVMGFLCLQCTLGGQLNVYRIPINRRAYASNGYNRELDDTNSVIIFNNYLHTNSMLDVEMMAKRLYNFDRIIDVNVNAQKTPILVQCEESQRLTVKNLYKQFDGNEPVIYGNKGLDTNALKVLKTDCPYVADKIYQLKQQYWNEALTYLGISSANTVKRERMVTDEVLRSLGGTIASRYSRLQSRREACTKINEMFGLNISVEFREDFEDFSENFSDTTDADADAMEEDNTHE